MPPVRRAILDAALAHVRAHGALHVNVSAIAAGLGMSHANVYRHFKSRDALLVELAGEWSGFILRILHREGSKGGPALRRIQSLFEALYAEKRKMAQSDAEMFALFRRVLENHPAMIAAYKKRLYATLVPVLEEAMAEGALPQQDAQRAARLLDEAASRFVHPLLMQVAPEPRPGDLSAVLSTMLAGLGANTRALQK